MPELFSAPALVPGLISPYYQLLCCRSCNHGKVDPAIKNIGWQSTLILLEQLLTKYDPSHIPIPLFDQPILKDTSAYTTPSSYDLAQGSGPYNLVWWTFVGRGHLQSSRPRQALGSRQGHISRRPPLGDAAPMDTTS